MWAEDRGLRVVSLPHSEQPAAVLKMTEYQLTIYSWKSGLIISMNKYSKVNTVVSNLFIANLVDIISCIVFLRVDNKVTLCPIYMNYLSSPLNILAASPQEENYLSNSMIKCKL